MGRRCSVDELHVDLELVTHRSCPHHGPNGIGHPATLADDASHVARRHCHVEADTAAGVVEFDPDTVGILHDRLDQVGQHINGMGSRKVVSAINISIVNIAINTVVVDGVAVTHDAVASLATASEGTLEAGGASPVYSAHAPEMVRSLRTASVG